jgi:hypothetical protein
MVFNHGACFSLSERPGGSGESFATIAEFLERHPKLRAPVPSPLQGACLDEIETERVRKITERRRAVDSESDSEGEDEEDEEDEDSDQEQGSTGYMNRESGSRSPPPDSNWQAMPKDQFMTMTVSTAPSSLPGPFQTTPTEDSSRPDTAKSPSLHWGPDISDIPAQRASMRADPDPYGSFGSPQPGQLPQGERRQKRSPRPPLHPPPAPAAAPSNPYAREASA